MTEYWKSQGRKFCDSCKCWLADNRPSIEFHENGKRHKFNVEKRLDELRKKASEDAAAQRSVNSHLVKMERAALEAYKKDLAENPQMAAIYQSDVATIKPVRMGAWKEEEDVETEAEKDKLAAKLEEKMKTKGIPRQEGLEDDEVEDELWQQLETAEGYPYYWNTKTAAVQWERPMKKPNINVPKVDVPKIEQTTTDVPVQAVKETVEEKEGKPESTAYVAPKFTFKRKVIPTVSSKPTSTDLPTTSSIGAWQPVEKSSPTITKDLQLPVTEPKPTSVPVIEITPEPKPTLFKEKTLSKSVTSANDDNKIDFKKRKIGGASIRQKNVE